MNGDISLVDQFIEKIENKDIVVALPNIFIAYAKYKFPKFKIATQDCSIYDDIGAHTGEISAKMLSLLSVEYVIIGHSERREKIATDSVENVYEKLNNVVRNNMTAILCIGDNYETLIDEKTANFLKNNKKLIVLAYEPLSSIGTGIVPQISEISKTLALLKKKYFVSKAIYGGSVNSSNAADILTAEEIDGVLIGGASLKLSEIQKILQYCKTAKS
jgi:triosephosphate isomerase